MKILYVVEPFLDFLKTSSYSFLQLWTFSNGYNEEKYHLMMQQELLLATESHFGVDVNTILLFTFCLWVCQICAAVAALRNTHSLSWPSSRKPAKAIPLDILDWLQAMFGFQVLYCSLPLLIYL